MCKLGMISRERLKIEVKLLLESYRMSYMLRRLAQQRMTLSDLEWPFHALHAICAVAEFLVLFIACKSGSCRHRNQVIVELAEVCDLLRYVIY